MSKLDACAKLLFQARIKGFKLHDIPEPIRPQTLTEGYLVQTRLAELLTPIKGRRVGVKAANTNESSQQFLSLPEPFFGPLLSVHEVSLKDKPKIIQGVSKMGVRICEPEFALQIGDHGKVIAVAPAIEIVQSVFIDWKQVGAPSLIADLACNGAWVRGEAVPVDKVTFGGCDLIVNGRHISRGQAGNVMGSPMNVLKALLTSNVSMFGGEIKRGEWISTGVCVDPPYHMCQPGDSILVEFDGNVGSVALICEI